MPSPAINQKRLIEDLDDVANTVHRMVECNFAMNAFLHSTRGRRSANETFAVSAREKMLRLWRGVIFLLKFRGIVFFAGYPYQERENDGYFQRIRIVDRLFSARWRIYVESEETPGRQRWLDRPEPKVVVLRIVGSPWFRWLLKALVLVAALRCRKIYFHSVLRMRENGFGTFMYIPGLTKVIDVHGVVPEEFRFHDDLYSALLYEREEQLALRKSDLVIVVSQAMENHLREKHQSDLRGQVAVFPMFPHFTPTVGPRAYDKGKPIVIYAGGLQKWQQVAKMIDAINRTASICSYRFYSPEPEAVRAILPEAVQEKVIVDRKTHEGLIGVYAHCHYGFILREDVVVNRVACPTKLVEYIAMGIVPIVDSQNIGDFKAMGMKCVTLEELLQGALPNEVHRVEMARNNLGIYERLADIQNKGARDIHKLLAEEKQSLTGPGLIMWVTKLFPTDTYRGLLARSLRRFLKDGLSYSKADSWALVHMWRNTSLKARLSNEAKCEVLVQVDNFEAGGLENVVLDLNDTLIKAGYKVVLLVLGKVGRGVQLARERGIPILVEPPRVDTYSLILDTLNPRLVLANYSIFGANLCYERNIPFIQIIHNTYVWFNDAQSGDFLIAADYTSLFVAVSEYVKQFSISRFGLDESHCVVIPNGIDSKSFDAFDSWDARREIRSKLGLSDQDFVFLSVGSVNHQKNHIATVRAFAAVAETIPRAKLVILGPNYEKSLLDEINCYVKNRALGGRVIYAGSTPSAQKYYAMADVHVSAAFFEGGPLNQIEAVRANLPSVISKVGFARHFEGLPGFEIIEPPLDVAKFRGGVHQLASTSAFENSLAKAMVRTYQHPCRPNLGPEVLRAFDKSQSYQCYVELIQNLLLGKDIRGREFSASWPNCLSTVESKNSQRHMPRSACSSVKKG